MSSFCNAKATHIFAAKISVYLPYFKIEILTSGKLTASLSFEQLGPECLYVFRFQKNGLT